LGLRKIKARLALLQQATENSKEVKETTVYTKHTENNSREEQT